MKIAVASDHRGFNVKDRILAQVAELQHEALDFGPSTSDICDYPDFGAKAARAMEAGHGLTHAQVGHALAHGTHNARVF